MARLEIPSIVVHNGSSSAPASPAMERGLDKQAELDAMGQDSELGGSLAAPFPVDGPGGGVTAGDPLEDEHRLPSTEPEDKPPPPRMRPHSKVKLLVRSHAMREETSPPPDPDAPRQAPPVQPPVPQQQPPTSGGHGLSLSVGRPSSRHKLRHQGSSQGSMDSSSPCLSRDSSTEQYTDSTGVDLHQFIADTLNRNHKDRMLLLKIEQELLSLAKDGKRSHHKFPPMSSYQRMLVHRAAAYFGMDHNVDTTGNAVIVNRTKSTRLPEARFREHIRDELLFPEEPRRSILKRDSSSFEEGCNFKDGGADSLHDSSRRSSQEELRWPGEVQPWSSSDSDTPGLRSAHLRPTRLLKVESFEGRDTLKANSLRLSVSKSYSFGGYPVSVLARGDSCSRLLTKQDSGSSMSSRLSPSSSGYKSQSQRSDTTMSATPSPTATPVSQLTQAQVSSQGALSPQPGAESSPSGQTVMWAVTSMAAVPPGSVLINPQTGQPYVNPDGSIYRYDPANPPKVVPGEEDSDSSGTLGAGSSSTITQSAAENSPTQSQHTHTHAKKAHNAVSLSSPVASVKAVPSTNVTTTATSPSLPLSPPPLSRCSPPPPQAPVLTVCHPYAPHPFQSVQGYAPQHHQPSEVVFTGQPQQAAPPPHQIVYTGFNVVPVAGGGQGPTFDQRHADPTGMSVSELGSYFMGLGVVTEQRGGGDASMGPTSAPAYWQPQPQPTSQMQHSQQPPPPAPQQQQSAQQPLPLYYVPPATGPSPPQQQQPPPPSNPNAPRYVATYPPYQPAPNPHAQSQHERTQPPITHNGGYIAGYPVASYGPVMAATAGNGECLPLYTQPALHMLYSTPTSINMNTLSNTTASMVPAPAPYYHHAASMGSYMQPNQPPGGYRAPTPPQTPTQNQALCSVGSHPYMYLNGGSYGPVFNGAGPGSGGAAPQSAPGTPSTPGPAPAPAQYIPPSIISNLGLFRTNMQMMSSVRSSPPPRPPRDGTGPKPGFNRSPSLGNKDRYDGCAGGDKAGSMRYPSMPVFGLRIMPGDMRLVGAPLQQPSPALRLPFSLPHRAQPHYPPPPEQSARPPKV